MNNIINMKIFIKTILFMRYIYHYYEKLSLHKIIIVKTIHSSLRLDIKTKNNLYARIILKNDHIILI